MNNMLLNRATGPYWAYWSMMTCNVTTVHVEKRTSIMFSFIISIVVNIGCGLRDLLLLLLRYTEIISIFWTMFSPTFVI
jgi:molybdopterin-containing oxidoreductase family membrane subunit